MTPKKLDFLFYLFFKWEKVFDEESGLWQFNHDSPSKRIVSSDRTCSDLKKNFQTRISPVNDMEFSSAETRCSCGVRIVFTSLLSYKKSDKYKTFFQLSKPFWQLSIHFINFI